MAVKAPGFGDRRKANAGGYCSTYKRPGYIRRIRTDLKETKLSHLAEQDRLRFRRRIQLLLTEPEMQRQSKTESNRLKHR